MSNPFPVMHGSMWKEPQTVDECIETRCRECAYSGNIKLPNGDFSPSICKHLQVLREVGELE